MNEQERVEHIAGELFVKAFSDTGINAKALEEALLTYGNTRAREAVEECAKVAKKDIPYIEFNMTDDQTTGATMQGIWTEKRIRSLLPTPSPTQDSPVGGQSDDSLTVVGPILGGTDLNSIMIRAREQREKECHGCEGLTKPTEHCIFPPCKNKSNFTPAQPVEPAKSCGNCGIKMKERQRGNCMKMYAESNPDTGIVNCSEWQPTPPKVTGGGKEGGGE